MIRDALAATPAKAAAGLALHEPGSVVLIAGGIDDLGGGPLHATPGERALFERAAAVAATACTHAALFGPAAPRLAAALDGSGARERHRPRDARGSRRGRTRPSAAPGRTILFAPWFHTTPEERAGFPGLLGL